MESSNFMKSNYTDNYNAIQLSLPLDLGIKIDPDDDYFARYAPLIHTHSPTFVIMILRVTDSRIYSERWTFIMPKKVSAKPILELRAHGLSMRKIEAIMHISRHTISAVYKAADDSHLYFLGQY